MGVEGETVPDMWTDQLKMGREWALAELKRLGYEPNGDYPNFHDLKSSAQWRLRQSGQAPVSQEECLLAVIEALVLQGGVPAWAGDGTCCVAQIIWNQHQRAEKFRYQVYAVLNMAKKFRAECNSGDAYSVMLQGVAAMLEDLCK